MLRASKLPNFPATVLGCRSVSKGTGFECNLKPALFMKGEQDEACTPKSQQFYRIHQLHAEDFASRSDPVTSVIIEDAIRLLDSVPATTVGHLQQSAEKLIVEKGALEALAAALAHISGATSVDQCSLINSEVGFVTMIFRCSIKMPNISYA
ncbi:hypothetical protein MJG53_019932 [Ovis ammon polii x Ovis aries]|uniref:Uncharacterized protein n=1 Tax=Ovis ammon polii x Ovis aries TaxID=2918886 RepID=A0ACB9U0V8_9CETA|nr:hypothetical protein MJG53_019932 [Ovis ammon polii x Ovis aries]